MKWILVFLVIVLSPALSFAQSHDSGPYAIVEGPSSAGAPTTFLLNTVTGETWVLAQMDKDGQVWYQLPVGATGTALWVPITIAGKAPSKGTTAIPNDPLGIR